MFPLLAPSEQRLEFGRSSELGRRSAKKNAPRRAHPTSHHWLSSTDQQILMEERWKCAEREAGESRIRRRALAGRAALLPCAVAMVRLPFDDFCCLVKNGLLGKAWAGCRIQAAARFFRGDWLQLSYA